LIILVILGEEYKLWTSSLCSFLQPPIFGPNILNTLSICSSLNARDQVSHPYRTTGKIILLCILIYMFLTADEKIKGSELNGRKLYPNSISP
jgi:hypothetical protein